MMISIKKCINERAWSSGGHTRLDPTRLISPTKISLIVFLLLLRETLAIVIFPIEGKVFSLQLSRGVFVLSQRIIWIEMQHPETERSFALLG